MESVCREIIESLDSVKNQAELQRLKIEVIKKHNVDKLPTNIELTNNATQEERVKYAKLLEAE